MQKGRYPTNSSGLTRLDLRVLDLLDALPWVIHVYLFCLFFEFFVLMGLGKHDRSPVYKVLRTSTDGNSAISSQIMSNP
jgi:hypothetical protein